MTDSEAAAMTPADGAYRWMRWAAFGLLALFVAAYIVLIAARPYYYYYDDALFYLQIGRSLAEGRGLTFAEGIPTNGFHPFWLLICSAIAFVTKTKAAQVMVTSALVVVLNLTWILVSLREFGRRLPIVPVVTGILLGAGYVFFFGFGMETALALVLYSGTLAAAIHHGETPTRRALLICALLAGLTVFARLDLVFAMLPIALLVAYRHWKEARDFVGLGLAAIVGGVPVLAWLLFNFIQFGAATPISGLLKFSANGSGLGLPSNSGIVYVFVAIALLVLLSSRIRIFKRLDGLATAVAGGHLIFYGYLVFFRTSEVYSWYFVVLAGSLAVLVPVLIGRTELLLQRYSTNFRAALVAIMLTGLMLISVFLYVRDAQRPLGVRIEQIDTPNSLVELAKNQGIQNVYTFDRPGILAFLGGLNAIAADGLTSNLNFQQEVRKNGLNWLFKTQDIQALVLADVRKRPGVCGLNFLNSSMIICIRDSNGHPEAIEARFYSRLDGAEIGRVDLRGLDRIRSDVGNPEEMFILARSSPRK